MQVINFLLERKLGFYLIQTYIPMFMTVAMSQVVFWINKESIPARTMAGMARHPSPSFMSLLSGVLMYALLYSFHNIFYSAFLSLMVLGLSPVASLKAAQ